MVVTAALIIILSAFNGLEAWVITLFNHADPELKVMATEGKTFEADNALFLNLKNVKGVKTMAPVLEDNVMFMYGDRQYIGILKGITPDNPSYAGIEPLMLDGDSDIFANDSLYDYALLGAGVATTLKINLDNSLRRLVVYFPRRGKKIQLFEPFRSVGVFPAGVFSIQQDYDSRYVWVPLHVAEEVLDIDGRLSAYEISLLPQADLNEVQKTISSLLPAGLTVKNRFEQQEIFYKVFKSERLILTVILTFILVLASFNIFGALTMLLVEKRRDTAVLRSMGFTVNKIRGIFWMQGFFICLLGCVFGLVLGLSVCYIQLYTGIIKSGPQIGAPPFPVIVSWADVAFGTCLVLCTGALVSFLRISLVKKAYFGSSLRSDT